MWRVTWRNLFARKVRLLLSAFAIVLGVAFVAGTLIFTNAMGGAFDDIIEGSTADVEVAFKGANDFDSGQDNRTFPAQCRRRARGTARGRVRQPAERPADRVRDRQGRKGRSAATAHPALPSTRPSADSLTGKPILSLTAGSYPTGRTRSRSTWTRPRRATSSVGDTVELATPGAATGDEGRAHRAGRVRVGRPERRDPDGLRRQVHAGAVLRRPGRVHHGLPQRGRGRLPDRAARTRRRRCCPPGWWRAPATPTSRRTRRTSTRSWGSCRPSCWSSPRSPSSSASSSSSTPSRSWSPSAVASSRCCGPWVPRAGRSTGRCCSRRSPWD